MQTRIVNGNEAFNVTGKALEIDGSLVWPFVIGQEETTELLEENLEMDDRDVGSIIAESLNQNALEIFESLRKEHADDAFEEEDDWKEVLGEWPNGIASKQGLTLNTNILNGGLLSSVAIGYASVQENWQIPAFLKYGNWNDCPPAEVHCSVHRYWSERYGARIVGVSNDVIECVVDKPPTTQEDAMELAMQQYAYCYDIVEQGTETVSNLAATLLNGRNWYFWWD